MLYDDLTIELSEPISYSLATETGHKQTSNILICQAPTPKEGKATAYLKQNFMRALGDMQRQNSSMRDAIIDKTEDDAPTEAMEMSGSLIIATLYNSDLDVYEYQLKFQSLICGSTGVSELVKINGELPLTSTHFKRLAHDDIDYFMGEYLSFFLVNSLLKKIQGL